MCFGLLDNVLKIRQFELLVGLLILGSIEESGSLNQKKLLIQLEFLFFNVNQVVFELGGKLFVFCLFHMAFDRLLAFQL